MFLPKYKKTQVNSLLNASTLFLFLSLQVSSHIQGKSTGYSYNHINKKGYFYSHAPSKTYYIPLLETLSISLIIKKHERFHAN